MTKDALENILYNTSGRPTKEIIQIMNSLTNGTPTTLTSIRDFQDESDVGSKNNSKID